MNPRIYSALLAGGTWLLIAGAGSAEEEGGEGGPPVPDGARAGAVDSRTSVAERPDAARFGEQDQISVTGGNPKARVMFLSFVRDLRKDFRWSIYKVFQANQTVGNRDAWEIPIRVELWGEVGDVYRGDDARMSVELRPDGRFHILLAARLHDAFEEEAFRLEAIRALVVEQMLTPFVKNPYALDVETLLAPEWVVHGFDEMIEHRRSGQRSVFYAGVLQSGLFLTPEELFSETAPLQLDPVSFAIYRVSAAAMVTALLEQEEGDFGMREFLGELTLAPGGGEFPLLRKHFPSFREMEQGLEKWWTLQVATMGQKQRFEFLDREETEQWLSEVLTIRFDGGEEARAAVVPGGEKRRFLERFRKPKPKGDAEAGSEGTAEPFVGTLDQFAVFLDREGVEEKLAQAFNNLQHLKMVGFPLYRPVFERYETVIARLGQGEVKGIREEIAEIERLRGTIRNTLVQAEDYLNHFEATRSPQRSDVFDDYMRMRKEFERRGAPQREDRITTYLDALEREFR